MPWASGDSLSPTNLNYKSGNAVNVLDVPYSADSLGANDSTTSIQNAVDTVEAAGGGVVYFPPGSYLVTGLTLDSDNVTLEGAGGRNSQLTLTSDNGGITISDCSNIVIRDLYLSNSTANTTSAAASGIRDDGGGGGTHHVTVSNVEIEGFYHGIRGNNTSDKWEMTNVYSHDNFFSGFMVDGTTQSFVNCRAKSNGTSRFNHGLYVNVLDDKICSGINVNGGSYVNNTGSGVVIGHESTGTITRVTVSGVNIIGNGTANDSSKHWALPISVAGSATGVIQNVAVSGCNIGSQTGLNGSGILVQRNTKNITISGCNISDCSEELIQAANTAVITGCWLSNTTNECITVGNTAPGTVISGNHFSDGSVRAITITGATYTTVTGNHTDDSFTGDAVRIESVGSCVIAGNTFDNNPIRIETSGEGNLLIGNQTGAGSIVDGGTNTQVISDVITQNKLLLNTVDLRATSHPLSLRTAANFDDMLVNQMRVVLAASGMSIAISSGDSLYDIGSATSAVQPTT